MTRAQAKTQRAAQGLRAVKLLLVRASHANAPRQRTVLLHRAASTWAEPLMAQAACRRGCAHCCHLPLLITSAEARLLAEANARPMTMPAKAIPLRDLLDADVLENLDAREGKTTPCPFLGAEGQCTSYAQRPAACRTHINLDDDDLLCRIVEGETVHAPYADARPLQALILMLQQDEFLADVREFFPDHADNGLR
ncbi:Flagellin N-methylase [Bordetella ansorpii]|uniref:Flagellin N-methylase n=2 Tax=Bordetella ansorpii TaxID=288768 RepID=A0A157SSK3_9BORD|nr:Flagellin N-methylase [Bordetella ansorpii]